MYGLVGIGTGGGLGTQTIAEHLKWCSAGSGGFTGSQSLIFRGFCSERLFFTPAAKDPNNLAGCHEARRHQVVGLCGEWEERPNKIRAIVSGPATQCTTRRSSLLRRCAPTRFFQSHCQAATLDTYCCEPLASATLEPMSPYLLNMCSRWRNMSLQKAARMPFNVSHAADDIKENICTFPTSERVCGLASSTVSSVTVRTPCP